jgi:ATP-dependent Lon protease
MFSKNDVHVHVPEGAVPKDGPSAGVTICTAIMSALTKRKVRHDIAMTGEITLRGNVLAIGGLKEKLLAALRGTIKTVYIPKDNEEDLKELPPNLVAGLDIKCVTHMQEILQASFLD